MRRIHALLAVTLSLGTGASGPRGPTGAEYGQGGQSHIVEDIPAVALACTVCWFGHRRRRGLTLGLTPHSDIGAPSLFLTIRSLRSR